MLKQDFNKEWTFQLNGGAKENVALPHDFSIIQKRSAESPAGWGNGYFPGGVGDYEKKIFVPEAWKNKTIILEFEGVYMNAIVRVNDDIVTRHPYGYTSFHCDITARLKFGQENIIRVHVNNSAQPNCRWYSGSGIYRPVWLMVAEQLHIKPYGIFIHTPEISSDYAIAKIESNLENFTNKENTIEIVSIIYNKDGKIVAQENHNALISAKSENTIEQKIKINNPDLWSDKTPYLYTLVTELYSEGKKIDSANTCFGIRSIEFLPGKGFLLNGQKTMLRGGDVHHDCGIVGARAFDDAEERKVRVLKENGFNAVRCSHNPPSPAFLNACDKYGILVIDEAFDGWHEPKLENDYSVFFDQWWKQDLTSMILRDRNHPCVILWSTGNEINERDGRSDGCKLAKELADFVRTIDSSRPVTCGINEKAKVPQELINCHDIVSFNYESKTYEEEFKKYPQRIILASENYLFDTFDYWMNAEKYPNVIGDFYWTAIDYFGESGLGMTRYLKGEMIPVYPWHQSFNSDIDICGFKRPQSYYRDCVWGLAKKPYIAVFRPEYYGWETGIAGWTWHDVVHSWTWPAFENKPIVVEVYSIDDEVELFLNGKSLGRKEAGKANKYIATFDIKYEPGELKAVSYSGGKKISEDILNTAGKPFELRLTADKDIIKIPDDSNTSVKTDKLVYITAELFDKSGNLIPNANNLVFFTVCGEGELIAVGSANPKSEEMYVGNLRRLYEGRALAVVRLNGNAGTITVNAMVNGLNSVNKIITVSQN